MTREEFIEILEEEGYSYKIEGDKLVVTHEGRVNLRSLQTLPSGVEFRNGENVDLRSLETLPPGVEFKNGGYVGLLSLKTISPGVVFKNGGDVDLDSLKTLPPGVVFNNRGDVYLNPLIEGWFHMWNGNIEGIESKMLLNLMISKGVFI